MTMVPSEIVANECIALPARPAPRRPSSPRPARDNAWAAEADRAARAGGRAGRAGGLEPDAARGRAPGLLDALAPLRRRPTLDDLGRDPSDRNRRVAPCRCSSSARASVGRCRRATPSSGPATSSSSPAASGRAGRCDETLLNANTAEYVVTGRDRPSSVLARLIDRFDGPSAATG